MASKSFLTPSVYPQKLKKPALADLFTVLNSAALRSVLPVCRFGRTSCRQGWCCLVHKYLVIDLVPPGDDLEVLVDILRLEARVLLQFVENAYFPT